MISAVFSVVDSLEDELKGTFNMLDDDVLFIQKWPWSFNEGDYPWWKYVQRREPSIRDMEVLSDRLSLAQTVVFQAKALMAVEAGNSRSEGIGVVAVTHGYADVISMDIGTGRFFTEAESAAGHALVVIGYEIAMNLFGKTNVLGEEIDLRGQRLRVIGVFAKQGTSFVGDGFDRAILIPAKFGYRVLDYSRDTAIMVKGREGVTIAAMQDEIIQQFRSVRRLRPLEDDDFSINQIDMITSMLDTMFDEMEIGGWFIGIFAILVGCFSIANIMFVSVRERTRIIGVQKAIGAKSTFIMTQFLFESVALCVFGALFALLFMQILVWILNAIDIGFVIGIRPSRVALALLVAVVSGLVSGLAPARAAARMEPVEAMRTTA